MPITQFIAPGGEEAHELVLEREVEATLPRVALTAGAATELVVDPAALVAFGAEHVEAAELADVVALFGALGLELGDERVELLGVLLGRGAAGEDLLGGEALGVAAEQDVDATTGHVRGHGDRVQATGLGDDHRLLIVLLRVEHRVRDAALVEQVGEQLALLDRDRAHEHRLAAVVALLDVVGERLELRGLGLVDEVGLVEADHGAVRGDLHDLEPVGVRELTGLGVRGTGHAGELLVELEVVLQRDGGEGLVLLLDPYALLGLHRLVQAVGPAATLEDATGELVDDLHLAVGHHVVDVALEELLALQRRGELVDEVLVHVLVEVVDAERLLHPVDALLGGDDRALRLVDLVVAVALERLHDPGELEVQRLRVVGTTRDDERRPRLVDEDRVDLVDDREVVPALGLLLERAAHVVAQVVEAELVVRAVRDVRGVRLALQRGVVDVGQHHTDLEPEEAVDLAHPLRVALGEVVVRRDLVDAEAADRVEVRRQRGDERLALTGLHLGDPAEVQRGAAHQLDVEVALAEDPPAGLADGGERLGEQVVEVLAPLGRRRNSPVCARSSSSERRSMSGSSALISGTIDWSSLSFRPSPALRTRLKRLIAAHPTGGDPEIRPFGASGRGRPAGARRAQSAARGGGPGAPGGGAGRGAPACRGRGSSW